MDYTVQWFLAYSGCFLAEDTHSWLVYSTAICSIGMFLCNVAFLLSCLQISNFVIADYTLVLQFAHLRSLFVNISIIDVHESQ